MTKTGTQRMMTSLLCYDKYFIFNCCDDYSENCTPCITLYELSVMMFLLEADSNPRDACSVLTIYVTK